MRWFRRRTDDDFSREIEAHLAIETEHLIADGLTPEEAAHAAARKFGNRAAAQERFYESRRILWLDELRQDVRYACGTLRRSPGFASVAVLMLVLGIGANTAIFSVVNAVLLRPLPYRDPGSLVLVETSPLSLSPPWLTAAWRERAGTLIDVAGFNGPRSATLIAGGEPTPVDSALVTWNFFSFLGVSPAAGRDFVESDGLPGAVPVAIITHELWMGQFGGTRDVVGRLVTVGGEPVTVIGVAPSGFRFPTGGALPVNALPVDTQPDVIRVAAPDAGLNVIGRLEPATTPEAARAELLAIFKQEATSHFPRLVDRLQLEAGLLQDRLVGDVRQRLRLVMGAVVFVLLVASANVANLLLARASTRQRELALRTALGARKGRLVRLLLTESVLLALIGAAGSIVFAYATGGIARMLLAARVPHVDGITIDWQVLGFCVAVAGLTGVVCGLVAIPGATRVDLATIFSASATPGVTGRSAVRRVLLSAEVAITFVLVIGAALLVQTFWNLSAKDRGFHADRVLTVRVAPGLPPGLDQKDPRAGEKYFATFFTNLTQQLARVPGIAGAAAVSSVPFAGLGASMGRLTVDGQSPVAADQASAAVAAVSPDYFRTMGIALSAGRDFDDRDRFGAEKVAIVNEAFRRRFAPAGNIIGSRIRADSNVITIVGVAGDVPESTLREAPEPVMFFALQQMAMHPFGWGALRMVLRTDRDDPLVMSATVRRAIWTVDRNIVIDEVATMDERMAATIRTERDSALLFALFAVGALVMAAVGVYGVAAYTLAQRTREIGIRVALGADRREVSRLVMSQNLWPAAVGIAIGIAAAAMATRLLASLIYGVTPLDPATFVGTAILLIAVVVVATSVPLRRALRINPLVALRYE